MERPVKGASGRAKLRISILLLVAVVLAVVRFVLWGPSSDRVTFRVVDAASGEVLTNAMAVSYGRWTPLGIEKLHFAVLDPWKTKRLAGVNGTFYGFRVPRQSSSAFERITFHNDGYGAAIFTVANDGYQINYSGRPLLLVPRTNLITVALEARERPGGALR